MDGPLNKTGGEPKRTQSSTKKFGGKGRTRRTADTTGAADELGLGDSNQDLTACRVNFITNVLGVGLDDNDVWNSTCTALQDRYSPDVFWTLYKCDEASGVWISNDTALGQSPSVDTFIDNCQNDGFYGIEDPGPPRPKTGVGVVDACYTSGAAGVVPCLVASATATAVTSTPSDAIITMARSSALPTRVPPFDIATAASASGLAILTGSSSSAASITTASSSPESPPPEGVQGSSAQSTATSSGGLPMGARVAIGVCSGLAALVVILAAFCLCRRRRHEARGTNSMASSQAHGSGLRLRTPSGSHTPLLPTPPQSSCCKTTPATPPPLRLNDRRFLPPSSARSRPGSPRSLAGSFPKSPICHPTITTPRMVPRSEHRSTKSASSTIRSPLCQSTTLRHGSLSSSTSSIAGASSITATVPYGASSWRKPDSVRSVNTTATATAGGISPASPTRPQRTNPHDDAVSLRTTADLMVLASPPPTYPLPLTPTSPRFPPSPLSPVFSAHAAFPPNSPLNTSPSAPSYAAAPAPLSSPANAAAAGPRSTSIGVALSSDVNHGNKTSPFLWRESWGVWKGSAVDDNSRSPGGRAAVPLSELDIHEMGGSHWD